jgi:hypothetical protein
MGKGLDCVLLAITRQTTAKWLAAVRKARLVVNTDDLFNAAAVGFVLDFVGCILVKQATMF